MTQNNLKQFYLKVCGAGAEQHLVCLGALSLADDGDVTEGVVVPQVLEVIDHGRLEIVPAKTKLLLIVHPILGSDFF